MSLKLTPELLIKAYSQGFFPMPDPQTEEILWFSPDPRAIIPLDKFHLSKSLAKKIKQHYFKMTIDQCFESVIDGCANRQETWINSEIKNAYLELHRVGHAHSIEVWHDEQLAGGLYGVHIGGAFFAESKFHNITDASKAALYFLVEHMKNQKMQLLEVQFLTEHLKTLGAIAISANQYEQELQKSIQSQIKFK